MRIGIVITAFLILFFTAGIGLATSPSPSPKPEFVPAEPADATVEEIVVRELERARVEGKNLMVYVGATWCEPCERFKAAVKAGQLDKALPNLRFLSFDRTRDEKRLERAGYLSRQIPLFAIPDKTGRASGQQIEGSIKGPGAIGNIVPRLRKLLRDSSH